MPRPLFLSKTGCNRCRVRRKKCDEDKPICGACRRLDFICTWTSEKSADTPLQTLPVIHQHDLVRRLPLSRNVTTGLPSFQSQTQFDLLLQYPSVFLDSLAPTASPKYQDVSSSMNMAFHDDCSRDAMCALSGWAFYTKTQDSFFRKASLESYQNAIVSLRDKLSKHVGPQDLIPLQLVITNLGIIESAFLGHPQRASYHYSAAARLWSRTMHETLLDRDWTSVHKVMAEYWLAGLVNSACFLSTAQLNHIMPCLDWAAFKLAFQQSSGPSLPICAVSPALVMDHYIFWLILQITHFGRQLQVDEKGSPRRQHQRQLHIWRSQVARIQNSLGSLYTDVPSVFAGTYRSTTLLFLYALQILLYKLLHPEVCSSNVLIRSLCNQALTLLQSPNLQRNLTTGLVWPMSILFCAVYERAIFDVLVSICSRISFDDGGALLMNRLLRTIMKLRKNKPCPGDNREPCTQRHDGLQLIFLEGGLLSVEGDEKIGTGGASDFPQIAVSSPRRSWMWNPVEE